MDTRPWPTGQKLVHLDLKGAPPRAEYLHRLLELLAQLEVDGLLLEYEDMFPYEGQLKLLQATAQPAYSPQEVLSLQEAARSKGMEVVPLIQTFGHMEFVLKHPSMRSLREVAHCVGTLNPHQDDGLKLVMEMLRQVVELHPGLETLHIGADEVYMLGEGEESKSWLASPGRTVEQLFLSHVTKVAKAVKEAWPQMRIIMWDDMMRGMSQDTLRGSGLVSLVEPMLWDYAPNLHVEQTVSLLEKYCGAGAAGVWAASSFKGSTSVHTCVPNTRRHVDNHRQWLKVAASVSAAVNLKGIALTGWQRYDHLSVLCELMPVALPSLVTCLQLLTDGQFNADTQRKVSEQLGISSVEVEDMDGAAAGEALFPGRTLAQRIVDLSSFLDSEDVRYFEQNTFVRGWFSPYHRRRTMVSPLIIMQIHTQVSTYLTVLQQKAEAVTQEMLRLYPQATAQEWLEEHVSPVLTPLQRIRDDITACLAAMESGR